MSDTNKRIVGVIKDLFFTVKIQDAAKRAGLNAVFVQSAADAYARAKESPALIVIDLNESSTGPLELIAGLKAGEQTKNIPLLGYVSHVQVDVRRAAEEAGCDAVLARSALSQNLPGLLARYAEAAAAE